MLHAEAVDFSGALERCEETIDVPFETSPWVYFFRRIVLAKACLGLRDYSAAWLQFDAVIKKTEGEGNDMDKLFYPYFCNSLCEYHLEVGEIDQARNRAEQLYDFTSRAPDRNYLALAHRVLARIAFVSADVAAVRRHLSKGLAIVETTPLPLAAWKVYVTAAVLYDEMGDHDKAAAYRRRGAAVVQTLASRRGIAIDLSCRLRDRDRERAALADAERAIDRPKSALNRMVCGSLPVCNG
jgi:tetratricopeptide (TPR) repeat protein